MTIGRFIAQKHLASYINKTFSTYLYTFSACIANTVKYYRDSIDYRDNYTLMIYHDMKFLLSPIPILASHVIFELM